MALSEDLQRDLHHAVRQVEEDGRSVVRRIEQVLPVSDRKRIRVAMAKLEVFVSDLEVLLFHDDAAGVDVEIEELNAASDRLFLQRAELDRHARRHRRETDRIALDRRALDNRHVTDELSAIERQLGPLGGA